MTTGIAVVGAGLIGGSIAWRQAQAGARVTLMDAGRFGGETSSAGAGMLSPGGEFEKPSAWLDMGLESMRLYPPFVEELKSETGLSIDFQVCGSHYLVEADAARRRAEFQRSMGVSVEVIEGGLRYPEDGLVDPGEVLRALRRACQARGVAIVENHRLAEIESGDHDALVIAAGAWSDQIRVTCQGRLVSLPAVKPVKGHLIGFDLAPGSLGPMLRRGHTYILQRASGFTVVGSTELQAGFDRTVNPAICAEIHHHAGELYPALRGTAPSKAWIGFRPYSPDGPHIRRVEGTNVWLAYGHYRNGILLAPWTARRVAGEILQA
jgi:glycine oxidase